MDSNDTAPVTPMREQLVDFYGDQIVAAQADDATIYVPIRPLCDFLGLTWPGQFERLKNNPVLNESLRLVSISRTTATGGVPDMLCLPLKFLPGWLFGVQASRVKPDLREKILRYQRECYDILWNAFKEDVTPPTTTPANLSHAEQAVQTARALLHLAEQQLAFELRLAEQEHKQQTMADFMRPFVEKTRETVRKQEAAIQAHGERLTSLELQLSSGAVISEAQATEVQLAVKAVAALLQQQGGGNGHQRVYSELYRRYGVGAYRQLPRERYNEVMAWLRAWFDELNNATGSAPTAG